MNPVRTAPAHRRARYAPSPSDRETAALAKAVGHPARIAILRLLIEHGDCICGDIVDVMPLAQATVSQHLKVLRQARLIRGEIDGPRRCYCVNPEVVKRLKSLIDDL